MNQGLTIKIDKIALINIRVQIKDKVDLEHHLEWEDQEDQEFLSNREDQEFLSNQEVQDSLEVRGDFIKTSQEILVQIIIWYQICNLNLK